MRDSYILPSADSIGTPPRTQMGPSQPFCLSCTSASDGSNSFSKDLPVFLSHRTSRPDGQIMASSMADCRASGSSDFCMRFLIPPARRQNREWSQNSGASVNSSSGPSNTSAFSMYGFLLAVSLPSKDIFRWVPSQKGLFLDAPQRHRI